MFFAIKLKALITVIFKNHRFKLYLNVKALKTRRTRIYIYKIELLYNIYLFLLYIIFIYSMVI